MTPIVISANTESLLQKFTHVITIHTFFVQQKQANECVTITVYGYSFLTHCSFASRTNLRKSSKMCLTL